MLLAASDVAPGDFFGDSIAVSGNTAIVAANGDDDDGADSGSAYVFTVPEPDALWMLCVGVGLLRAMGRRRANRHI